MIDGTATTDLVTLVLGVLGLGGLAILGALAALLRKPPTHPDEMATHVPSRSTEAARKDHEDAAHKREVLRDEIAKAKADPAKEHDALTDIVKKRWKGKH